MRLHIVNPNTTASMTQAIAKAARSVAAPDVAITATEPDFGPASIEGFYDGAFAVPGMLVRIMGAEKAGCDAHVIACFDDTGLDAARSAAVAPVVGIGEAAFHVASLLGVKFSVVTTLSRSIPVIEANLVRYGLDRRCARVRASDVPVLALEADAAAAERKIGAEIERALKEDGADCIVLGCAGMAGLAERFWAQFKVPVVDGVAAGVGLATALARLKLRTSKAGGYAAPGPKAYSGLFERFSPKF
ncbi:MAG: aspartate/glutamate racemase family protein [Pseudorhodoplanes sp.]